ncbi:MAG: DegT/DnrJ/EryC1/StrS family aminotransferase, partial [SAR202 cluster bacterium]|nr:DegT/DnrJ/EryC1/StrS family aminotransferase [SAR202 cluster bacterium]
MAKLAIRGGTPVRSQPFPSYRTIGEEEKLAVMEVMDRGVLSQFQGEDGPNFLGGPKVRELEKTWCDYLGTRHAVAVNSATSGLNAAIGALGIAPGDEVICTPYTMSASATCALVYHAIPVFADVDADTFNLDPEAVRRVITPRTRAIVVVHLFGQPANMDGIMAIAREHHLKVVEDAAQAPGATYKGRPVGTIGDIGVFSLNYHKHIHTGEGGICTTNDDDLALRLALIRNHGEVVVGSKGVLDIANTV